MESRNTRHRLRLLPRAGLRRSCAITAAVALLSSGTIALAGSASAAEPKPDNPNGATATITTQTVAPGGTVSFTGTGWTTTASSEHGAVIGGVKLDDNDQLNTTSITAKSDGTMSGSVTLPAGVTSGEHWLRFLSGSDQPGDPTRSLHATFSVGTTATASVTLLTSAVAPGGSLAASGAHFGAGATVTVKLDKTTTLTTTTADGSGAFAGLAVPVPADVDTGAHTLYFLAAGGISVQVPITVDDDTTSSGDGDSQATTQYQIGGTLTGAGGSYEVAVDAPLGAAFIASPKDGATGSIAVVDLATRELRDTWDLASAPYGIAVNTTTHRLYTTDTRLNQVSVYDAKTSNLLATIPGLNGGHGLEADSAHNLVYVTLPGTGQVAVIDGNSNEVISTVAAGKTPVQVVIDAPHDSYWVSSTGDNTVREFDRASNKVIASVTTAAGPQNMALNPSTGELLVDNFGAASVQVIDTNTASVAATIPVSASPIGISVDTSANMYFVTHLTTDAVTGTSAVSVIDGNSRTVSQALTVPGTALGVGTDAATHTTYVTNRDGAEISVIVPIGASVGPGSGDGPRQGGVVVSATVPETGGLAMSISSGAVMLSPAAPNSALSALVSSGMLPTVTVADFRVSDPGWSINGKIGSFSSDSGATLSGSRLGWTPNVLTTAASQKVTAGAKVNPAETGGLASGATLASAAAGAGRGTATVNAALSFSVPTDTAPGTYSALLTLTAI